MAIAYPSKLSLAQLPTPLQPMDRYSELLGGPRIWLKRDDLTGSVTSGNKIRKLEYTLAHAKAQGCKAVITCGGLQSNHCRSTALLAAQLGMRCSLVLRGEKPSSLSANLLLDTLAGANIHFFAESTYNKQLNTLLNNEKQRYLTEESISAHIIPTGASDGIGVWGYIECAEELTHDFKRLAIAPSHIIHATGSGGTQAGLTLGAHLYHLAAQVVAINVCDDETYFQNKVRSDMRDCNSRYQLNVDVEALPINVLDGYVGAGYAKASDEVLACIAEVARTEGIVFDPVYSGKAFYGLTQEIRKGRFSQSTDIVFIHTGGIFGLYAYEDSFKTLLNK
jgi:D-cysteine desulfhydrase